MSAAEEVPDASERGAGRFWSSSGLATRFADDEAPLARRGAGRFCGCCERGRRRLGFLSLDNPLHGLPALLRFLHRGGAKSIVYDFEQL